jgi:glucan 1,3-beta-glucosidase
MRILSLGVVAAVTAAWPDVGASVSHAASSHDLLPPRGLASDATATPPPTATCSPLEEGVDYIGYDLAGVPGNVTDCCSKCANYTGCWAFSWTNYNGGTCYLKSTKGESRVLLGVTSAALPGAPTPPPSQCSPLENGVDYVGNDLTGVPGQPADCCNKCANYIGCWAFSWANNDGGMCYLKSAKGESRYASGVVSGALPGAPTPAPTTLRPLTPRPTTLEPPPTGHVQWKIRSGVIPARSANLGGWLVAEHWMTKSSPAWQGVDAATAESGEYITMQLLGKSKGTAQFEQHRSTWITEADIIELANAGLNTVRVPIGFWIVHDDPAYPATAISEVYAAGSLKYLDTLINNWAVTHNIAVMISLHAHQGSQNGNDHSAPQEIGKKNWYTSQANVNNSIQFATFVAARYRNSEAFLGLNLMNEPSVPTSYEVLLGYYTEAYRQIRATGNECIIVTSPLVEQQLPDVMAGFMPLPAFYNVWHELHPYFKWGYEGRDELQIIDAARGYRASVLDKWNGNPLYLGEWSLGSPELTAPFKNRTLLGQYAAVQLKNYEAATSGWAFWAWRNDQELETATTGILSGWSMRQALREGIFTVPRV